MIPIYHMSTAKHPVLVTNTFTNLMRRFYWGKMEKTRYLAYVSCERICKPMMEGGLGVRDLKTVNDALLLKALWKVAVGSTVQWVQLAKVKYYQRSLLWLSGRTYNCTPCGDR